MERRNRLSAISTVTVLTPTRPDQLTAVAPVPTAKDIPLEALRGLAAIAVVLHHAVAGFFPEKSGLLPGFDPAQSFRQEIWYTLMNGTSAVTFFFVLSGFVLARRYVLTGDTRILVRGAFKRWPRLAGPVLLVVLGSWCLWQLGAYGFAEAGRITRSDWLEKFAYGLTQPLPPELGGAILQGSFLTFFRGDFSYDSSLWTMRHELVGSFVVFGAAALLAGTRSWTARAVIWFSVAAAAHYASPYLATFLAGLALALILPRERRDAPAWAAMPLLLLALYLLGHTDGARGAFLPLTLASPGVPAAYVAALGSALLIVAVEVSPGIRARLSGRIAAALGTLSFPLYLVHVPVLCSLGCAVLLGSIGHLTGPRYWAVAATIVGSVLAALPVVAFNEVWLRWVDRLARRVLAQDDRPAVRLP